MKVTYYLEVLSSWCHAAEPAWAELKRRYGSRVDFQWRIALMDPGDFPASKDQCEWFYRRVEAIADTVSGLNSGWFEPERRGSYDSYNLVAEAGRDLGFGDDRLRLALNAAGIQEGLKVEDMDVAVSVASRRLGIDPAALRERATSDEVRTRVDLSTAQFKALGVGQRPTFVIEDAIGDKAILSGLFRPAPLIATLQAMFADEAGYAAYAERHGRPPA